MEQWKDIKIKKKGKIHDFTGLYRVNTHGDIWSYTKNCLITAKRNTNGYLKVALAKNGCKSSFLIHRIVAEVFIPNPDNLPEVNHIDEDKTNNSVNNLEWCNHKYNLNHGTASKRIAEKQSKIIQQFTMDGELVKEWKSTRECGRNGFHRCYVCACCRGEKSQYNGFIWRYK